MKNRSPEWIAHKKQCQERRELFIRSVDEADKVRFVRKWIEENRSEENSPDTGEGEHALRVCVYDADLGWELILRIVGSSKSDRCLSRLGAWHLEDWLSIHGYSVIERVEKEAIRSKAFAWALSNVYQNSMPRGVYRRIRAAVTQALDDGGHKS